MKNKRGIFFTSMAIIIISLFLVSLALYSQLSEKNTIEKRIQTMNSFVFSLENDISRQNYISGYRAILSIESYITSKGEFIADSEASMREALLSGTVQSEPINLMEGFQIKDWNSRITDLGEKINVEANYTLQDLTISQDDPWHILIQAKINLQVRDKNNLASWNKTETINSKIDITGFEDPIYLINTNGKVTNKITKTPYTIFVQGNDVSNLTNHSANSYYIESATAPSFLQRLEGKTTSDTQGIESLVNLRELSQQGMIIEQKSVVDYIYFSSNNPTSYKISGMPAWFWLDTPHLSTYQVSNLTI